MIDKNRQKQRRNLTKLFLQVFLAVLLIGSVGLLLIYVGQKPEEMSVYEFFQLPFSEQDKYAETTLDKEMNMNQQLLEEAMAKGEKVKAVPCASEDKTTILFAGDVLLDDSYAVMSSYRSRGAVITEAFSQELLDVMRSADVFMVNNEFTFTNRGTPTPAKSFTFRANPENVKFYQEMGVDIVSIANNHIYDFGEISLLDTMETLNNADIPYMGAGENLEEAMQPLYLIANGVKIAIVSATQIEKNSVPDTKEATEESPGVLRCMNPDNLLKAIETAKQNADFTILYIHWGTESQETIDWLQEEQGLLYAQAGVDLIIGNHSHCLQKLDTVAGVPVIYSLGNFWFNSRTQNTCLVEVTFHMGSMETFRFIPCLQSDCRTRILEGQDKEEVLSYMRRISPNVTIDEEGYVTF